MENITRRRFVIHSSKLLVFIPFVGVIGCISDKDSTLSSEDSLKRLIYIIGPWSIEDNLIAENFARRFLKTDYGDQYLSKSNKLIQSLSKQVSEETIAVKEIDLNNMPKEDKLVETSISETPDPIIDFIGSEAWELKMKELICNTSNNKAFIKRFFAWFNLFMVLRFVHFYRDKYEGNIPVADAAERLLEILDQKSESPEPKDLLKKFREIEKFGSFFIFD